MGYILEPEYTEEELAQLDRREYEQIEGEEEQEAMEDDAHRMGNTGWCTCDHCVPMPTVKESLCCNEDSANLLEKLHEDYIECVTEHRDFTAICLTPPVLEVIMYGLREVRGYGQQHNWENRTYRLVAYRAYTFWVHQKLGRHNRKVIPSCVVNAIRRQFPSLDGQYSGFQDIVEAFNL